MSDKKPEYWKDDPPLLIMTYPHPGGWHSTNYVPENRALAAEAELIVLRTRLSDLTKGPYEPTQCRSHWHVGHDGSTYDAEGARAECDRRNAAFRLEGEFYEVADVIWDDFADDQPPTLKFYLLGARGDIHQGDHVRIRKVTK